MFSCWFMRTFFRLRWMNLYVLAIDKLWYQIGFWHQTRSTKNKNRKILQYRCCSKLDDEWYGACAIVWLKRAWGDNSQIIFRVKASLSVCLCVCLCPSLSLFECRPDEFPPLHFLFLVWFTYSRHEFYCYLHDCYGVKSRYL